MQEAERVAREALELAHRIENRQGVVYLLALLARIAAEEGNLTRAGLLWGAVEVEEEQGTVGQWEEERDAYAERVLAHADEVFEAGRKAGRGLCLDEAIERAVQDLR